MTRTESSLKTHKVLSHTHSLAVSPKRHAWRTEFLDDHRALEPPDPIPNSAVKRCIADGSVGFPHVSRQVGFLSFWGSRKARSRARRLRSYATPAAPTGLQWTCWSCRGRARP